MRKLVWARFALSDRVAIFNHIEAENPTAAIHVDKLVGLAIRRLLDFPESERPGRISGTREVVISRTVYIAAYTVSGDTIRILRILHGAQMWPDEMTDD